MITLFVKKTRSQTSSSTNGSSKYKQVQKHCSSWAETNKPGASNRVILWNSTISDQSVVRHSFVFFFMQAYQLLHNPNDNADFCSYCLHVGEAINKSSCRVNECNNRIRSWPDISDLCFCLFRNILGRLMLIDDVIANGFLFTGSYSLVSSYATIFFWICESFMQPDKSSGHIQSKTAYVLLVFIGWLTANEHRWRSSALTG